MSQISKAQMNAEMDAALLAKTEKQDDREVCCGAACLKCLYWNRRREADVVGERVRGDPRKHPSKAKGGGPGAQQFFRYEWLPFSREKLI